MNTKIATGIFAFAAMLTMYAGSAQAQVLEDGSYSFTVQKVGGFNATIKKVGMAGKRGVYVIQNGNVGNLSYSSKEDGAKVEKNGPNASRWVLHKNSGGWNLMVEGKEENVLSIGGGPDKMTLRRNNAGGKGNSDQIFQIEKK